jgi:hypothetical protein
VLERGSGEGSLEASQIRPCNDALPNHLDSGVKPTEKLPQVLSVKSKDLSRKQYKSSSHKSTKEKRKTNHPSQISGTVNTYTYYWFCPWCDSGTAYTRDNCACLNSSCGTMRRYDDETAVHWEMHEDR